MEPIRLALFSCGCEPREPGPECQGTGDRGCFWRGVETPPESGARRVAGIARPASSVNSLSSPPLAGQGCQLAFDERLQLPTQARALPVDLQIHGVPVVRERHELKVIHAEEAAGRLEVPERTGLAGND